MSSKYKNGKWVYGCDCCSFETPDLSQLTSVGMTHPFCRDVNRFLNEGHTIFSARLCAECIELYKD